ncbi:hypothetical protein AVEN_174612-1 [Araneus ventricosus]|uniref:Uncharacterized protein n=1 Tax=Araneus ventricosus TaxID=182803 RepID=A0A4Y2RWY7_ARAVE|nr:hypothetical protein AVEN_174612-1 [Araneus ventricosus]
MVFNRFDLEVGVDDRVSNEPRCINYDPEKFILKYLKFFPVGWGCKSRDRCGIVADVLPESEFVINNEPEVLNFCHPLNSFVKKFQISRVEVGATVTENDGLAFVCVNSNSPLS